MAWGDLQVGDIVVEKPNHSSVKWCYWIKAADGYIYALHSELLGRGIKCHPQPDGATSIEQGQIGPRFVWRNGKNLFEEK